jgi:hypothetical protein
MIKCGCKSGKLRLDLVYHEVMTTLTLGVHNNMERIRAATVL